MPVVKEQQMQRPAAQQMQRSAVQEQAGAEAQRADLRSQLLRSGGNVSQLLQHTRQTLQAALKEVKECRSARAACQDELSNCQQGSATQMQAEAALHTEEERCFDELSKTREAYKTRVAEVQELRLKLESRGSDSSRVTELGQQLAQLQARCDPKTLEAQCEKACSNRVNKVEATYRKRLEDMTRTAKMCRSKLDAQQQLEAQIGSLRKKLELKEQLEAVIEGKHSKLTEVYKTLEAECQNELRACKEGRPGAKEAKEAKEGGAAGAAAGGAAAAEASAPCVASGEGWQFLSLLVALLLGFLGGIFTPQSLVRQLPGMGLLRKPEVQEMRGWVQSPMVAMDMKIS